MAKKLSKGWTRVLSILFHLAVLALFIAIYDSGMEVYKKFVPQFAERGDVEVSEDSDASGGSSEKKKEAPQAVGGGTTMADLMEAKRRKDEGKSKTAVKEDPSQKD